MTVDQGLLADRLALADLAAAYARAADRRDPEGSAATFTEDGLLAIYHGQPGAEPPTMERRGREAIAKAMVGLNRYTETTHLVGQQLVQIEGDRATGETYCLAHHLSGEGSQRIIYIMSIRYLDVFARTAEGWRIAERRLAVDWTETRSVAS